MFTEGYFRVKSFASFILDIVIFGSKISDRRLIFLSKIFDRILIFVSKIFIFFLFSSRNLSMINLPGSNFRVEKNFYKFFLSVFLQIPWCSINQNLDFLLKLRHQLISTFEKSAQFWDYFRLIKRKGRFAQLTN